MLAAIDFGQLKEWIAFAKYENEQEQRADMAAQAEAKLGALKRERNR